MKIRLKNVRTVLVTIGLIGVLLFASPTISLLVKTPSGLKFSELYVLGPNHTFGNLPFNIVADVNYSVYLGVVNQMGSSCYYRSYVKIGNETGSLPNATLGTPSSLPALYEYNSLLVDGETWETPLTFEVNGLSFSGGISSIAGVTINGLEFPVNLTSAWDSKNSGYYYYLLVELWLFNSELDIPQYDNRYVSLFLNMTQ
ncbi:MAG: DUF1616 domain-containing protein [Candidatus Bathyarchaeia archaeon]|jgi:uncharacterized membrane protein